MKKMTMYKSAERLNKNLKEQKKLDVPKVNGLSDGDISEAFEFGLSEAIRLTQKYRERGWACDNVMSLAISIGIMKTRK